MNKILLFLFCSLVFSASGFAQGSPATAYHMTENSDTTGQLAANGDSDYYSLTTTADGTLTIYFTSPEGQAIWCYLYDKDGTTVLSNAYTYSSDSLVVGGLAQGTYYVEIYAYYGGTPTYTVGNQLYPPAQANDHEPNNNPSEADILLQEDSVQGHVAYYYNQMIDTSDWYKLVTNGNGTIQINYTSWDGNALIATLYDYTGTTELGSGDSYSSGSFSVGSLGAGTYYVKITSYYNSAVPYTLYDTLISVGGNDPEPNNNASEADTLLVDNSVAGNVGYTYSGVVDTSDWFKVQITDGELMISDTSENGTDLEAILYDSLGNNLDNSNTASKTSFAIDGLAAGTYYVELYSYFGGGIPYILSDSLFTYGFADDTIPNDHPYQAPIIRPESTITGHIGFLNDQSVRDSVDWYAFNYGGGDSTLTLNLDPEISTGTYADVNVNIYSDTSASPIYSGGYQSAVNTINPTGIPSGHYYISITINFTGQVAAYSITSANFTDLPVNLTSFTGQLLKGAVFLNWTTASEQNNSYFDVQRSLDGNSFTSIGKVTGNGTTSQPHNYEFTDLNPYYGANYYRLKQVNYDGTSAFSKIISVNYSGSEPLFQLYPNPTSDQIHLILPQVKGSSAIEIFDSHGQSVLTEKLSGNSTNEQVDISRLPSGIYLVVWTTGGGLQQTWKVVKQ